MLWLTDAQETMCTYESDPDYIGEFLRIIEDWQLKMLDMVLDIGVDIVTRFPGLYGGCPWEKVEWMIESWKKYA